MDCIQTECLSPKDRLGLVPTRFQNRRTKVVFHELSRKFLTTDQWRYNLMSYAGPASRPRPTAHIEPTEPAESTETSGQSGFRALKPLRVPPRLDGRRDTIAAFAAGIALGLTIGAGAALLFAPQSGPDTRRALARRGRRLTRRGHDAWDDLREELGRAARRGRRALTRRRRRTQEGSTE
jgi:hypothetical protein